MFRRPNIETMSTDGLVREVLDLRIELSQWRRIAFAIVGVDLLIALAVLKYVYLV